MTYMADLQEYEYTPTELALLAVGWLDESHEFVSGTVDQAIIDTLKEWAAESAVNRTRGLHRCGLCSHEVSAAGGRRRPAVEVEFHGKTLTLGGAEIWIEDPAGAQYATPDLIIHYIAAHGYRPPERFLEAVMRGRPIPIA